MRSLVTTFSRAFCLDSQPWSWSTDSFLTRSYPSFLRNDKLARNLRTQIMRVTTVFSVFSHKPLITRCLCRVSRSNLRFHSKYFGLLVGSSLCLITILLLFWILVGLYVRKISSKRTDMMICFIYERIFIKSVIVDSTSFFEWSALSLCASSILSVISVSRLKIRIKSWPCSVLMMKWHFYILGCCLFEFL